MYKKILLCLTPTLLSGNVIESKKPFSASTYSCIKTVSAAGALGGAAGAIASGKSIEEILTITIEGATTGALLGWAIAVITPIMTKNMLLKDFPHNKLEEPPFIFVNESYVVDGMRIGMCAITSSALAYLIIANSALSK